MMIRTHAESDEFDATNGNFFADAFFSVTGFQGSIDRAKRHRDIQGNIGCADSADRFGWLIDAHSIMFKARFNLWN